MFLVVGVAVAPLAIYGSSISDSGRFNLRWAKEFAWQFWHGIAYPRWLPGSFEQFGAPTFYYYPPLPFWWASLFQFFADQQGLPWRSLGLAEAVVSIACAITCYHWLREIVENRIASIFGALVYALGLYQLVLNVYVRGAYAEHFAYIFLPLSFLAVYRISQDAQRSFAPLSLSYAGLLLSHLPTTLLATPFLLSMPFFLKRSNRLLAGLFKIGAATGLGVGLSAVYVLPAMLLQHLNDSRMWWAGDYQFDLSFLMQWPSMAADSKTSTYNLVFLIFVSIAALCLLKLLRWAPRRLMEKRLKRVTIFHAFVFTIATFLCLPVSKFIWTTLPLLTKVQFPWRLLGIMEFGLASLLAVLVVVIGREHSNARVINLACSFGVVALLAMAMWSARPFMLGDRTAAGEWSRLASVGFEGPEYGTAFAPDYLTSPTYHDGFPRYVTLEKLESSPKIMGRASVEVIVWNPPFQIILNVEESDGAIIHLPHFFFPMWRADVVGLPDGTQFLPIGASMDHGLIEISAPPGSNYNIILSPKKMAIEKIGMIITVGSLLCLLVYTFKLTLRRYAHRVQVPGSMASRDIESRRVE